MLEQNNSLVQTIQAAAGGEAPDTATIVIDEEGHVGQGHARPWNAPTTDQVAAILPGDGTTASKSRELVLRIRGGGLMRIHDCHPWYFPSHYLLLFPRGEPGWTPGMPLRVVAGPAEEQPAEQQPPRQEEDGEGEEGAGGGEGNGKTRTITLNQWLSFYLHPRANGSNILHLSDRLLQEFICDGFATLDQQRLRWVSLNQTKLRACMYRGVADAVQRGDTDAATVGRAIILPSSHLDSPRSMQQLYQDAMAIVRKKGKPDLFITMTCNPQWREIQEQLLPGQTALGRPDLLDRVFKLKINLSPRSCTKLSARTCCMAPAAAPPATRPAWRTASAPSVSRVNGKTR